MVLLCEKKRQIKSHLLWRTVRWTELRTDFKKLSIVQKTNAWLGSWEFGSNYSIEAEEVRFHDVKLFVKWKEKKTRPIDASSSDTRENPQNPDEKLLYSLWSYTDGPTHQRTNPLTEMRGCEDVRKNSIRCHVEGKKASFDLNGSSVILPLYVDMVHMTFSSTEWYSGNLTKIASLSAQSKPSFLLHSPTRKCF